MSEEHQDKLRVFMPMDTTSVPPELTRTERELKEAQKAEKLKQDLIEAEKREEATLQDKVDELRRQWELFKADSTNLDKVTAHGIEWGIPGFIIEVFVADFANKSGLILDADLYKKTTPYGKILSASPLNESPKNEWKAGDIVYLGDGMANLLVNSDHVAWTEGKKSNARFVGPEPPAYIKKVYATVSDGRLYYPDKSRYVLTDKYTVLTQNNMKEYPGPWCVVFDQFSVPMRVTGNPFA